jgi:hypothetical protein
MPAAGFWVGIFAVLVEMHDVAKDVIATQANMNLKYFNWVPYFSRKVVLCYF